jgi:hypothetical protein
VNLQHRALPRRGATIVVWVLAAVFATRAALFFPGPPTMDWQKLLIRIFSDWVVWLLFAPAIVALSRKFPFDGNGWRIALPVHFAAALFALVVHALIRRSLGAVIMWIPSDPLSVLLYAQAHINFMTYWAVVGATHIYDYYSRYRERELRAAELERQLTRAQLDALTSQLQPHFLFNTMNSISAFMRTDAERADRMLARLSELLRATLQHNNAQEITLRQELHFVDQYLEIQQERFADLLTIERDVGQETLDALLPPLILQPIVENAVQHGIAARLNGGRLTIIARRDDDMLEVRVIDSGGEKAQEATTGTGIGLANTQRRLEQLYGQDFELRLHHVPAHGSELLMRIPFRR